MREFLSQYKNPYEDKINFGLMDKSLDRDIVDYIVKSFVSLEVLGNIKFLGYTYEDDEKNIDTAKYINIRKNTGSKVKKRGNKNVEYKYMKMTDTRYKELKLKFQLSYKGEECLVNKNILIPIPDDDGYYLIRGKKYMLMYQMTDNSTYTTANSLVLKSLSAISIKRVGCRFKDTEGNYYTPPIYMLELFKKGIDVILFYLAKVGLDTTLKFFNVDAIMKLEREADTNLDKFINFRISRTATLVVNRYFFDKYQYVQSIVGMIMSVSTTRLKYENFFDTEFWLEKLGKSSASSKVYNFIERGRNNLIYFQRLTDDITRDVLKVPEEYKSSTFRLVKWMIQNYNELRKKDHFNLDNKRLRCNEYISTLLIQELSSKINSVISARNSDIKKFQDIFKFSGDIICQQLLMTGLLVSDTVNDLDFYEKFKYTKKGPNSLGSTYSKTGKKKNKGEKTISKAHKTIYPSFLGRVDINVSGNSDPKIIWGVV